VVFNPLKQKLAEIVFNDSVCTAKVNTALLYYKDRVNAKTVPLSPCRRQGGEDLDLSTSLTA
jgi:hypothetical protein